MKKTFILLTLIASLSLSGCALFQKKVDVPPAIDTKSTVQIDKRLLKDCPDLVVLTEPTEAAIVSASKDWITKYADCRAEKHELNETVKKAFNLQ
jgi:hypothetical protein